MKFMIPMPGSKAVPAKAEEKAMSVRTLFASIGAKFKLGARKALDVEKAALPLEEAVAGGISLINPTIGMTLADGLAVVGKVEQVATAVGASAGTGPQKLQAALPELEAAVLADPLFKGKTISNQAAWNAALVALATAFVGLGNSVASTAPDSPTTEPAK